MRQIHAAALLVLVVVAAEAAVTGGHPLQVSSMSSGTGQIGGVVTTTADGAPRPVRRAIVRLASNDLRGSREVATDDLGRFLFTDLPAGRFMLSASRPGYVSMSYGARGFRGAGSPIVLANGERVLALRFHLPRGAVITGTLTDAAGEPYQALVMALERTIIDGRAMLQQRGSAVADDRGAYRIYGLPADTYLIAISTPGPMREAMLPTTDAELRWAADQGAVSGAPYTVAPPIARPVTFAPVFYPGVHAAGAASPVTVAEGQEREGVDLVVRLVPVSRVSGVVMRPDGAPATGVNLSLSTASGEPAVPMSTRSNATTTSRGEFTFSAVPPGRYLLTAQASSAGAPTGRGAARPAPSDLWLHEPIDVAGDVSGLHLMLRPGVMIRGRIVANPSAGLPPLDLARVRVSASPGSSSPIVFTRQALLNEADGTFTIPSVPASSFRMTVSLAQAGLSGRPAWLVQSIVLNGRDVLDREFDVSSGRDIDDVVITLTDRAGELSGRLLDRQGRPTPEFAVILFPADREQWSRTAARAPRATRADSTGIFRFEGLPPGTYYLAAATDVDSGELSNAAYLEQFVPGAVSVTIGLGERKVQDLRISGS